MITDVAETIARQKLMEDIAKLIYVFEGEFKNESLVGCLVEFLGDNSSFEFNGEKFCRTKDRAITGEEK